MKRIFLIVLDSCGVGYEPDAADFGDVGADTLRACAKSPEFDMIPISSLFSLPHYGKSPLSRTIKEILEQGTGIEPAFVAWEATVLPMN